MNKTYILLIIIFILIILLFINYKKLKNITESYNLLKIQKKEIENESNRVQRELERCKEQIKIYEKEEQYVPYIKVNGRKLEINPIYRGKRALVGDYSEDTSENTMRILKTFGLTVDIVRTSNDVIDRIKQGYKYDIIFLNNHFKNSSGAGTLASLRSIEGFNTPVIIHTASENQREKFINKEGFDDYLVKPLRQEETKIVLDRFLNIKKKKTKKG